MRALITGASSGIGKATAEYFSDNGYTVYGLARREIDSKKVNSIKCDVTNVDEVKQSIKQVIEKEGQIDVLINNAGCGISGSIEFSEVEEIKKMFEVNFIGVTNVTQAVLPYMRSQSFGKIINTSSVASIIPIPYQAYYSATKSALDIWAKALRIELQPFNIKVTNVLVGDTKTGFTSSRVKSNKDTENIYTERQNKSVAKMEKDEQNGKSPLTVAKTMFKVAKKYNPPMIKTVGFEYKMIVFQAN